MSETDLPAGPPAVDELAARRAPNDNKPEARQVCAACKKPKRASEFAMSRKNPGRRVRVCSECAGAAGGVQTPGQRRAKREAAAQPSPEATVEAAEAIGRFAQVEDLAGLRTAMQSGVGVMGKVMYQRALAGDAAMMKLCLEVAGAKDAGAEDDKGLDQFLADDPGAATDTA